MRPKRLAKKPTDNLNKRGRKKKEEIVPSLDGLNELLNNTDISQNKNTRPKRVYNKR